MGIVSVLYSLLVAALFPAEPGGAPKLALGLAHIWNLPQILFLQGVWLTILLHTGLSTATGSSLSFHVHRDRV